MSTITKQVIENTMVALEKNKMKAYFVETKEEVVGLLQSLLKEGDVLASGGSMTLAECGVIKLLQSGKYKYLDRSTPNLTDEEITKVFRDSFFADAYITSSNAITQDGALVNVDGNANRVAAISFGPSKVYVVAGINKIVSDENAAFERVRNIAAVKNVNRLGAKTPCSVTGKCENCASPSRICCTYVVHRQQRHINRINVILVNENLGY